MSDYPTESPNDDILGRLGVAAMDVYAAEDDRRRAREAEIARRRGMMRVSSPPGECWVDLLVGNYGKVIKFSENLYWRDFAYVDREIERVRAELQAMNDHDTSVEKAHMELIERHLGKPVGGTP